MQKRLFISTLLLISLIVITLSGISNWMVSSLITQRQAEFEQISFNQASQGFQNAILRAEGTMDLLLKNRDIKKAMTDSFDRKNSFQSLLFRNNIEFAVGAPGINKDNLESIIFIGKNNFSCLYTKKDNFFFETSILDSFDSLEELIKNDLNWLPLGTSNNPVIHKIGASETYKNSDLMELLDLKIVLARKFESSGNTLEGIIIVVIRQDLLSKIIPESSYNRSLFLTGNEGKLIWSNSETTEKTESLLQLIEFNSLNWSKKEEWENNKVLVTGKVIEPSGFRIIGITPVKEYYKQNTYLGITTIWFALGSIAIAFLCSLYFSHKTTSQLEFLTGQLSSQDGDIPEHVQISTDKTWRGKVTLRQRLYIHFGLSVLVPLILFSSILFILDYQVYKKKIVDLLLNSSQQFRWRIEDTFSALDILSTQLIFDNTIQGILALPSSEEGSQILKNQASALFLEGNIQSREILSYSIYDYTGKCLASNMSFNTFKVTELFPYFFQKIALTSGNFEYLETNNNFLGMGSSLIFARKIFSKNSTFGALIGYLTISIDKEALLSRSMGQTSLEAGRFQLLDSTNITENNLGVKEIKVANGKILTLSDPLSINGLILSSSIPLSAIAIKIWPLIIIEIIVLGLTFIFCILASLLISRKFIKPLQKLGGLMDDISKENFNVRMFYDGEDEVTVLALNFNLMVDRLNRLIHENYLSRIEQSELKLLEKEAQLSSLQQQINPHFLYNTLQSIQWMAYKANEMEISRMTTALGRFFRGVVHKGNGLVSIGDELDNLEHYLVIQRIRYKEKLAVIINITTEAKRFTTLQLILQPLVENAIVHGIEPLTHGGVVEISVFIKGDFLNIEIKDNGIGIRTQRLNEIQQDLRNSKAQGKASIGLSNVYKRLNLHFGEAGTLNIDSGIDIGTTIKVSHPVIDSIERLT